MQYDGDVVSPHDFTALSCSWRCTGPGGKKQEPVIRYPDLDGFCGGLTCQRPASHHLF